MPDVPHVQAGRELRQAIPQMAGFATSFAVVGLFWVAHHGLFRYIKGIDRPLVLLNLLFLGTIAFVPYPTALLSAAGDEVPATIFYAASMAAVGLAEAAVWLYAIRIRELALPGVSPAVRRWVLLRILRTPVVFLLSIPVALVWPNLAKWLWLLIFVGGSGWRAGRGRAGGYLGSDRSRHAKGLKPDRSGSRWPPEYQPTRPAVPLPSERPRSTRLLGVFASRSGNRSGGSTGLEFWSQFALFATVRRRAGMQNVRSAHISGRLGTQARGTWKAGWDWSASFEGCTERASPQRVFGLRVM